MQFFHPCCAEKGAWTWYEKKFQHLYAEVLGTTNTCNLTEAGKQLGLCCMANSAQYRVCKPGTGQ